MEAFWLAVGFFVGLLTVALWRACRQRRRFSLHIKPVTQTTNPQGTKETHLMAVANLTKNDTFTSGVEVKNADGIAIPGSQIAFSSSDSAALEVTDNGDGTFTGKALADEATAQVLATVEAGDVDIEIALDVAISVDGAPATASFTEPVITVNPAP